MKDRVQEEHFAVDLRQIRSGGLLVSEGWLGAMLMSSLAVPLPWLFEPRIYQPTLRTSELTGLA